MFVFGVEFWVDDIVVKCSKCSKIDQWTILHTIVGRRNRLQDLSRDSSLCEVCFARLVDGNVSDLWRFHIVNSVVSLKQRKTHQKEIVIVTKHSDVTRATVARLRNVKQILIRLNLNPMAIKHKVNGTPPRITLRKSDSLINLVLRTARALNDVRNERLIVSLRDKHVRRARVGDSVREPLFESECILVASASKGNSLEPLGPEKVGVHWNVDHVIERATFDHVYLRWTNVDVGDARINSLHVKAKLSCRDIALRHEKFNVKRANFIFSVGRQKERSVHT